MYGILCTYVVPQDFGGAWWNFIPKVIADQTVWSIFLNAAYSTMIMGLQGMSSDKVISRGKISPPCLKLES